MFSILGWVLFIISPFIWRFIFNKMKEKENAIFGRYPCCDLVNNAIRSISKGDTDSAIEDLLQSVWKAEGYLHEDVEKFAMEAHERVWTKLQHHD